MVNLRSRGIIVTIDNGIHDSVVSLGIFRDRIRCSGRGICSVCCSGCIVFSGFKSAHGVLDVRIKGTAFSRENIFISLYLSIVFGDFIIYVRKVRPVVLQILPFLHKALTQYSELGHICVLIRRKVLRKFCECLTVYASDGIKLHVLSNKRLNVLLSLLLKKLCRLSGASGFGVHDLGSGVVRHQGIVCCLAFSAGCGNLIVVIILPSGQQGIVILNASLPFDQVLNGEFCLIFACGIGITLLHDGQPICPEVIQRLLIVVIEIFILKL